jgi:DNA-binding MarR family transcriptional regulator
MSVRTPRTGLTAFRGASRTDAVEALARAFKEVGTALRRLKGRETHHPGELSYAQYGLLFALADGRPLPLREVSHAAGVSPATAAEMLDALAAAGLVERIRSVEDKRIVLTSLTERGRALVKQRRRLYEPRWREALKEFSTEELLTAAAVLDRIRAMFDQLAGGCGPPARPGGPPARPGGPPARPGGPPVRRGVEPPARGGGEPPPVR